MKFVKLNNNLEVPMLGFGTYPLNGLALEKTILNVYKNGARSIDTSPAYYNEDSLGLILKYMNLDKTDSLFITTKLNNRSQLEGHVREGLLSSMEKLGIDTIDLYLMHWPYPEKFLDSWKQMESFYKEGLVKAIGVCNFHEHHLEKLLEIAEVVPVINQIEVHPLLSQESLRKYCKDKGIQVQAYSPIARMNSKLIEHPILIKLAKKYEKTVPQIILRWHIQNEIIVISKSENEIRIKENLNIFNFELAQDDMIIIDSMNEDYRTRFNPDTVDYINVLKY
jgi:diketogulonate reductase-like aldo/keto reductase